MKQADIAIIGAGPGGYVAALRASQLGAKVICIEKQWMGGVCLNCGCIPTKALLRSAEVFSLVQEAQQFGVMVEGATLDWSKAMTHKKKTVSRMTRGVGMLLDKAGVEVLMGEARFTRANTLTVTGEDGEETVQADKIIIATGSRPLIVPIPGLDGPNVITSLEALEMETLPKSLCIIGGGAIGLEFASIMNAAGVEVTIVEMLPSLAPLMDESIGKGLARAFKRKKIKIMTETRVTGIEDSAEGCVVTVEDSDGSETVTAEKVLASIGRAPNVENLGLEVLGIQPTRKGIQVDDRMRTAVPGVYAIGDVALDGPMLAHVASHQGVVAVEDAMGLTASMDYTAVPACIFSQPEAAGVGLTEAQAKEQGIAYKVGEFPLSANGKAVAMGETFGQIKVIAREADDAVIGLHILGPHASDLVLEGTLAIELETTLHEIVHTIHGHPTLGETIAEAAMAADGLALHIPKK